MTLTRPAGDADEVYRLPLPAAVGVREGLNLPRYPTFKGRLTSKKAAVESAEQQPEAGGQRMVRLVQTAEQVTETEVIGTGPEAADRVVEILEELEVLR